MNSVEGAQRFLDRLYRYDLSRLIEGASYVLEVSVDEWGFGGTNLTLYTCRPYSDALRYLGKYPVDVPRPIPYI
jgi:hypothetical protein